MVLLHPNESNREWYLFDRFEYLYKQLCVLFRYYFGAKIIQQALLWKFFIPFLFSKSSNTIVPKSIKFRDANGFRQITKIAHCLENILGPVPNSNCSLFFFFSFLRQFARILWRNFISRLSGAKNPDTLSPPPPGVNSFHSLSLSFFPLFVCIFRPRLDERATLTSHNLSGGLNFFPPPLLNRS